jgi:hypothetical protein
LMRKGKLLVLQPLTLHTNMLCVMSRMLDQWLQCSDSLSKEVNELLCSGAASFPTSLRIRSLLWSSLSFINHRHWRKWIIIYHKEQRYASFPHLHFCALKLFPKFLFQVSLNYLRWNSFN